LHSCNVKLLHNSACLLWGGGKDALTECPPHTMSGSLPSDEVGKSYRMCNEAFSLSKKSDDESWHHRICKVRHPPRPRQSLPRRRPMRSSKSLPVCFALAVGFLLLFSAECVLARLALSAPLTRLSSHDYTILSNDRFHQS